MDSIPGSHAAVDSDFNVETHHGEHATVVRVSGELDLATCPTLEAELARAGTSSGPPLILDLREVSFMDSTGLSLMVRAQRRAAQSGRALAVVKGGDQVRRLLELTGVADRLTLIDSPEEFRPGPS
ncbi:MAG: STAS domain-containing protein [Solirubrobacterales bacterium]|nr:STAS domain-containing protein [Solirubrobacterales bacterium]MBV9714396.1 STAS domain-containing protein [Solirubrobacterales bacterium]